MKQLSVAIAVFNEEKNLARCLSSIRNIADEVIIVDGGSTDKTVAIAKEFNATVIETNNPLNFHINKEKAVSACHGEWILQIDADEEVSPKLAEEIKQVIDHADNHSIEKRKEKIFLRHQHLIEERDHLQYQTSGPVVAFFLPRRNLFLGKAMTYAGMYPDGVIRLFKKGKAYVPAQSVHEQLHVEGRVSWLNNDLLHYSNPTLERYVIGADTYTALLAKDIQKEKQKGIFLFFSYCFIKPLITFWTLLIRHKGILDGIHGVLFCFFSALHYPVAYYKYVTKKY